jgi:hypothetical protein
MHEHEVGTSFEGPVTTHPANRVTAQNNILDYTPVKTVKFSIIMSLD